MKFIAISQMVIKKLALKKKQTRDELYEMLGYHDFEKKLDELFKK
ncbi:hypothetical protein [Campylobacter sp.]|nr:hypothetical protein [Campylobacter sp.]